MTSKAAAKVVLEAGRSVQQFVRDYWQHFSPKPLVPVRLSNSRHTTHSRPIILPGERSGPT